MVLLFGKGDVGFSSAVLKMYLLHIQPYYFCSILIKGKVPFCSVLFSPVCRPDSLHLEGSRLLDTLKGPLSKAFMWFDLHIFISLGA